MKQKTLPLFLFLLLAGMQAQAQPVITSTQLLTIFTDTVSMLQTSTPPGPGPSGANVTWDFSGLSASDMKEAMRVGDCPGEPLCSDFPTANSYSKGIFLSTGNITYTMSRKTQQKLETTGSKDDTQPAIVYSDPKTEYEFPLSYQQTFGDTYTWSGNGGTGSGMVDYTIDGYGTIITPMGTFSNVLRRKMVQRDTTTSGGNTIVVEIVTYTWLRADQPGLILHYLEGTLLSPAAGPIQVVINYGNNPPSTATGIGEPGLSDASIQVYPNPVTDGHFRVRSEHLIRYVCLTNLVGQTFYEAHTRNSTTDFSINLVKPVAGTYLLTIDTDKGSCVKKITVAY